MSPSNHSAPPRVAVITCAVLELEIRHFARALSHIVHIEQLDKNLHGDPNKLRVTLQTTIERLEAETPAEAIVLGYGLCSRGTEGVKTKRCRLVMARAHDCITHLLGNKERYAKYVAENPGTYWYSSGWNKHSLMPGKERYDATRRYYVEEYGEEDTDFLMESEQQWFKAYNNAAFVDLGVGDTPKELAYTQCAQWLGWKCDHLCGDPSLIRALLSGPWDNDRFLVLQPGQIFRMTDDERVIEPVTPLLSPMRSPSEKQFQFLINTPVSASPLVSYQSRRHEMLAPPILSTSRIPTFNRKDSQGFFCFSFKYETGTAISTS